MLMAATEDGRGMTNPQLRDEVMTLVMAGHETTANALAWTFYLLSKDPEVERRLRREVGSAIGDRAPTAEDAPRLEVLDDGCAGIDAPLPAGVGARAAGIGGRRRRRVPRPGQVARRALAVSPPPAPGVLGEPRGLRPRAIRRPTRCEERPKFAYLPFGGGPRMCIGMGFAMMEAQMILARIAQRYRLELEPGQRVEPEPVVTLRPLGGLWMRVRRQSADGRERHPKSVSRTSCRICWDRSLERASAAASASIAAASACTTWSSTKATAAASRNAKERASSLA